MAVKTTLTYLYLLAYIRVRIFFTEVPGNETTLHDKVQNTADVLMHVLCVCAYASAVRHFNSVPWRKGYKIHILRRYHYEAILFKKKHAIQDKEKAFEVLEARRKGDVRYIDKS